MFRLWDVAFDGVDSVSGIEILEGGDTRAGVQHSHGLRIGVVHVFIKKGKGIPMNVPKELCSDGSRKSLDDSVVVPCPSFEAFPVSRWNVSEDVDELVVLFGVVEFLDEPSQGVVRVRLVQIQEEIGLLTVASVYRYYLQLWSKFQRIRSPAKICPNYFPKFLSPSSARVRLVFSVRDFYFYVASFPRYSSHMMTDFITVDIP